LCKREEDAEEFYGDLTKTKMKDIYMKRTNCKVCQIYKFKDKFLNSKNRDMYLKVV
jgi:hypothetical protein